MAETKTSSSWVTLVESFWICWAKKEIEKRKKKKENRLENRNLRALVPLRPIVLNKISIRKNVTNKKR